MGMNMQDFLNAGSDRSGAEDPEDPKFLLGVDPKRDAPLAQTIRNINAGVPAHPMTWEGKPVEAGTGAVLEQPTKVPAAKGMSFEEFAGKPAASSWEKDLESAVKSIQSFSADEFRERNIFTNIGAFLYKKATGQVTEGTGASRGPQLEEVLRNATNPQLREMAEVDWKSAPATFAREAGKMPLTTIVELLKGLAYDPELLGLSGVKALHSATTVGKTLKGAAVGAGVMASMSTAQQARERETLQGEKIGGDAFTGALLGGGLGLAGGMFGKKAAKAVPKTEADYGSAQEFTADLERAAQAEALSAVDKARNAEQRAYELMQSGASKKQVEAIRKQNPAVGEALDRMMERRRIITEDFGETLQGEVIPAGQHIPGIDPDISGVAPGIQSGPRLPRPKVPALEDLSNRFTLDQLQGGKADPKLLALLAGLGMTAAGFLALDPADREDAKVLGLGVALLGGTAPAAGALRPLGALLKENPYGFKLLERLPQDRHTFTKKQVWEQVAREDIPLAEKEHVRYVLLNHPQETITAKELLKQLNLDTADWRLTAQTTSNLADYGLERIGRTKQDALPVVTMYNLPFEAAKNNHFSNPKLYGWVRSFREGGVEHVVELQSDLMQKQRPLSAQQRRVLEDQIRTNEQAAQVLNDWDPATGLQELQRRSVIAEAAVRGNLQARAQSLGVFDSFSRAIGSGDLSGLGKHTINWLETARTQTLQNWKLRNLEAQTQLKSAAGNPRVGPLATDWEARLIREELAQEAKERRIMQESLAEKQKQLQNTSDPQQRAFVEESIRDLESMLRNNATMRFATPDTVAKVEGWSVADPVNLGISAAGVSPVFAKASPILVFGREGRLPGTGRWKYTKEEGLQKEILLEDGSSMFARVSLFNAEARQVLMDHYREYGHINKLFEDTVTRYLESQKRIPDLKQMSRAEVEAALKPAWDAGVYLIQPQTAGIYTRYKRVVEPILRKLGGTDYTDHSGHSWIEVPVKPEHAQPKMFGQSGKADPRLLARMAAVGLGTTLGLWASDKDHKWMGAALGALVGAGLGMGPTKLVNTWKGLWKPDTRVRIDDLTNAWDFAQDKAAKLAWDLQRSVEKLVPDEAGRARVTQWLDGNRTVQLSGAEQRAATMVRAWFDGMKNAAQKAGVLKNAWDDYVTHLWDWKFGAKQSPILEAFWDRMEGRGAGMGTKSPYAKERSFSTLEDGKRAGLVPLTEDISAIIGIYSNSMSRAMANKTLVDGLKQAKLSNGIKLVLPYDKAPHFYEGIDGLQGVRVHPDIAPSLRFLYSKAPNSALAVGTEMLNTALKRSAVSFSLFHVKALFDAGLAGTSKPLKFLKDLPKFASGSTDLLQQLRQQGLTPAIELAYKSGLKFGLEKGARAMEDVGTDSFYAGLKSLQKTLDSTLEGAGAPIKGLAEFNHKFDKFMWDWVHTGGKLSIFMEKVEALMESSAKRHASDPSIPLLTREQAGAIAASYTNDLLGGLNWRRLAEASSTRWGRNMALELYSRRGRWWAQLALFAPDWTLSTTRAMTQAFGKGSGIKGLFDPTTLADLHRQYLARAGAYYFVIGNVLNQALSGHWLWENEDPTSIDVGDGRKLQWSKHTMEPVHWLTRPGQQAVNKMGILPKEALEQTLNVDYLSTKGNMRPMEGSRIEHATKKLLPISAASSFESGAESGLLGFAGIPIHGRKTSDIAYERLMKRLEKLERRGE